MGDAEKDVYFLLAFGSQKEREEGQASLNDLTLLLGRALVREAERPEVLCWVTLDVGGSIKMIFLCQVYRNPTFLNSRDLETVIHITKTNRGGLDVIAMLRSPSWGACYLQKIIQTPSLCLKTPPNLSPSCLLTFLSPWFSNADLRSEQCLPCPLSYYRVPAGLFFLLPVCVKGIHRLSLSTVPLLG